MTIRLSDRIALFASLPNDLLNHLDETLTQVELPANTLLFREGEPGDCFYIVLAGQVEIIKAWGTEQARTLAIRSAGDFIGEMGLLVRDGLRTASVITRSDAQLLKITQTDFDLLLQRDPALARAMLRELSIRLRETDNILIRDLQEKNRQLAQAYEELKVAQAQIIEKETLERELQMARKIQESILPRTLPRSPDFDFGARMEPARAVGGDFFDIIPLDRDVYGIVIGDISDKGVPAAIFMALTRSLLRAKATRAVAPRKVLLRVNRLLLEMNEAGMFATVLYGVLDCSRYEFAYARAGHEPPLLFLPDGERLISPLSPGQPLGLFPDPEIDEQRLHIPSGSTLLLYTDGATDAANGQGDLFGLERLVESVRANLETPAQALCDHLLAILIEHQGAGSQTDDITLVGVRADKVAVHG
jgi:serine phosphatase RsbU (regulator of sigma subunit)